MRFLLFLLFTLSALAEAAPVKRKISNSDNYYCLIERDGGDRKDYQREYRFPFPVTADETYELKGSLRFNRYSLVFKQGQPVELSFSEMIEKEIVTANQTKALEGNPGNLKTSLELKRGVKVIKYSIDCHPE